MSHAKLHFCPECETMLKAETTEAAETTASTQLVCGNCTFKIAIENGKFLKTSIYKQTLATNISKAAIYDPALKISCSIKCPNGECPGNDPDKVGTYDDETGKLIFPEVCISNNTNISRINTYNCRVCRTIFEFTN